MLEKIILLIAGAVFLAFVDVTPEDVENRRRVSVAPPPVITKSRDLSAPVAEISPAQAKLIAEVSAHAAAVDGALEILGRYVAIQSHPDALRYAFEAYFNYRAAHPDQVRKPYFYFVDFGLDSRTPRGYVFDMDAKSVVEGPFTVAHGRGSAVGGASLPTRFLNVNGSNATSLGLYLAEETYGFRGKSGGRAYRSVGLRLKGVSGHFNSAARARGIVVHGAPYVTSQRAGRSEGCPAMEPALAERLIPQIANGGLVFHFSPADARWMQEEPWVAVTAARLAALDDSGEASRADG